MIWNARPMFGHGLFRGHNWLHIKVCKFEKTHRDGVLILNCLVLSCDLKQILRLGNSLCDL
jgi:hypothetical protein